MDTVANRTTQSGSVLLLVMIALLVASLIIGAMSQSAIYDRQMVNRFTRVMKRVRV